MKNPQPHSHSLFLKKTTFILAIATVLGFGPAAVTIHAASLDVDFQATIASEQHPDYAGEAQYYHVSTNSANPGTGSYAATIVGSNDPAPPFVRNYDGAVVAYKFAGGTNNDITAVAVSGGAASTITFTTTDTSFDGFGQSQGKVWTTTDPGPDIEVAGADPYSASGDENNTGGWRGLGGATGTIDVSALAGGSVHIYYGAFNETPTVSVVMRDTDGSEPDITIADAHSIADGGNGDSANRTEYYLAEIDFVTDGVYDEIEFTWDSNGDADLSTGNGRGLAVVVTDAPAPDAIDPTLAPADIVDDASGGPINSVTPLAYTVAYSELMDPATIDTTDFELTGTASGTIDSVAHYGSATIVNVLPTLGTNGELQLQVQVDAVITDLAGNELDTSSAIVDDNTVLIGDVVAPTVDTIESPSVSGTIYGTPTITYTVTFSETMSTVTSSNFTNVGDAPFSIGTVTDVTPGPPPTPSVYTVEVIPSGAGTVQLELQGTIEDVAGNDLAVPVTDTKIFILDTGTEPARAAVTLDEFTTSIDTSATHDLIFDASASDKLVVIITGENGNGQLTGNCSGITYDGVALTQAIDRNPIASAPSADEDSIYNDIWYLDDPAAATALAHEDDPDLGTTGNIRATVDNRGAITAIRLSGTAPGVGATVISAQEVRTVDVLAATSGGMVLGSFGMGGDASSANVDSVDTVPVEAEVSAIEQGSQWNGHVTSQASVALPGIVTVEFTGGNTVGSHTIAAEFLGALVSADPFADWSELDGATGVTFEGDANGDGVEDGLAFLLGAANPNIDAIAADLLPTVTKTAGGLELNFNCLPIADRGTAKLYVQHSADLNTWTPSPTGVEVPDISGGPTDDISFVIGAGPPALNSVTATIGSDAATDGKLFGRLQATATE